MLTEAFGVFQGQEAAFEVEAVEVALEVAIFGDDAVAGYYDGYGVAAISLADGADGVFVAQPFGNELVAGGAAVGDGEELLPAGLVEFGGAGEVEGEIKVLALAGEVFFELLLGGEDVLVLSGLVKDVGWNDLFVGDQIKALNAFWAGHDFENAKVGAEVALFHRVNLLFSSVELQGLAALRLAI